MNQNRPSFWKKYSFWVSGLAASLTPLSLSAAGLFIKRLTVCLLGVILALILIAAGVIFLLWHNEIGALLSFEQVRERDYQHKDGSVYMMHIPGGFYLEDFIEQGGVKSDEELIAFVTEKITKGLIPMTINPTKVGCASFTAQTQEGDKLFARNYDFNETSVCIVTTDGGNGRHATISSVDLQFLGLNRFKDAEGIMDRIICLAAPYAPLDGINDAGVSCGVYMSYQGNVKTISTNQDTGKPDITSTTLLRLILDYADNIEEAIEIAKSYDLHDSGNSSYHYMVADASGRSAILEWVNLTDRYDNDGAKRELVVIYNDDDEAVGSLEADAYHQCVTNFIVAPGYYDNAPSKPKNGYDRYAKLYHELNAVNGIVQSEEEAMRILLGVGRRTWNNDDGNGCTVHSAIYNMTDRTVLWVSNENLEDETAVFRLSFK